MFSFFSERLKFNQTRTYLIAVSFAAVLFLIVFQNTGMLPFKNFSDFVFFLVLGLLLALYRPGWCFVFFVGFLALENINFAFKSAPLMIRPYQLFGFLAISGLVFQILSKRTAFKLPKFHWIDALLIMFALAGFMSALFSAQKSVSLKQSIVALSFVFLYAITRIYIQSLDDLKKIIPFFMGGGFVVALYAVWQNVRFAKGLNAFEIMSGRPNATFSEADWFGIYLVFLLSIILTMIYFESKKTIVSNFQFQIFNKFSISQFLNYVFLCLIFIALILTVSRSAWLGAVAVIFGFLIVTILNGSIRPSHWQWKNFLFVSLKIILTFVCAILIVNIFRLTTFQLFNRAQSTGGLQKITIACSIDHNEIPEKINSIDDLDKYGCRHINLEEIENEKKAGNVVLEVYRPDPNVGIRAQIYKASIEQIKMNPFWGIGWGTISSILGTDERGAGLNASNIFLETWLGSGILGFFAIVVTFAYIFGRSAYLYFKENSIAPIFLLLGGIAIFVPNLFNSGIFLGFVWVYMGIAISLLGNNKD